MAAKVPPADMADETLLPTQMLELLITVQTKFLPASKHRFHHKFERNRTCDEKATSKIDEESR